MGEIRGNHFHGGLDVRTKFTTGLPLYASAEGYISKINMDSQGYGNCLFVKHPNGYVTVYAHLEKLAEPYATWVREQQYKQERFQVELTCAKNQFPVKQGDIIAYSGNTGSSAGPHLHWEIRDTTDAIYNPLLYGFTEVKDTKPPYFCQIALRPMNAASRVEGKFERKAFATKKLPTHFAISEPIEVYGSLGLELWAHDRLSEGSQRAGVMLKQVLLDGKEIYRHSTAYLSAKELKQINHHIAFDVLRTTGHKFEKLYQDDGNCLRGVRPINGYGFLQIKDTAKHELKILLEDPYGNKTYCQATLKGKVFKEKPLPTAVPAGEIDFDFSQSGNYLTVKAGPLADKDRILQLFTLKGNKFVERAYTQNNKAVFIYDLRQGLPDSVIVAGQAAELTYALTVLPELANQTVKGRLASFSFDAYSVFDTTHVTLEEDEEEGCFSIGSSMIPMQGYGTVSFPLPPASEGDPKNWGIYLMPNYESGYPRFVGNQITGNEIKGRAKYFGTYKLIRDEKPPQIRPIQTTKNSLRFLIADNMSGINSWRCTVNGKWVLLHYEHKRNLLFSEKLNPTDSFEGEMIMELRDNANNVSTYKLNIQ